MIPSCLRLNEYQKQQLDRFVASLPKDKLEEAFEEGCTIDSPVAFEIRQTGIGDVVHAKSCGMRVWLDDGLEP